MLDPNMDAHALYRLASDTSLLTPEILEEIRHHEACYQALESWARYAQTGVDLTLVPVPEPPVVATPDPEEDVLDVFEESPRVAEPPRRWWGREKTPLDEIQTRPRSKRGRTDKNKLDAVGERRLPPRLFIPAALALILLVVALAWVLGRETTPASTPSPAPLPQTPTQSVLAQAGGAGFSCVSEAQGVRCIGQNTRAQLGTSEQVHTNTITLAAPATLLTAGADFACASTGSGVTCWGDNRWKQAADTDQAQVGPTEIDALKGQTITSLSAGEAFACATTGGGQTWCWGTDYHGEVSGSGKQGEKAHAPARLTVPENHQARAVIASRFSACLIAEDNSSWCWGSNADRRITDTVSEIAPVTKVGN